MDQLSILLACFNEEQTIEGCLRALLEAAPQAEIIVIHGGTDGTLEIARRLSRQYPQIRTYKNYGDCGKGHAVKLGITVTDRPYLLQFDADMQFDPAEVLTVVGPLFAGEADLVVGSRFHRDSKSDCDFHFLRVVGNRVVNRWMSILARRTITDVTTGYKAWTRGAIETIHFRDNRFVYEMEIVMRAAVAGLRIREVPISYHNRAAGLSGHGAGLREIWSVCTCGLSILWRSLLIRLRLW